LGDVLNGLLLCKFGFVRGFFNDKMVVVEFWLFWVMLVWRGCCLFRGLIDRCVEVAVWWGREEVGFWVVVDWVCQKVINDIVFRLVPLRR